MTFCAPKHHSHNSCQLTAPCLSELQSETTGRTEKMSRDLELLPLQLSVPPLTNARWCGLWEEPRARHFPPLSCYVRAFFFFMFLQAEDHVTYQLLLPASLNQFTLAHLITKDSLISMLHKAFFPLCLSPSPTVLITILFFRCLTQTSR